MPDPMAVAAGVSHKALLPVAGVPMLLRVTAALRATPGVGRIIVAIEHPEATLAGLAGLEDVVLRPAGASPARSVAAAFAEFGAPMLVTAADAPLLTPAMVTRVLSATPPQAAAAAAVARDRTVLAAFPTTRRTWLRFRDGAFSGCNLFLLAAPEASGVVAFWQRLEQRRKQPWAMMRLLGPLLLLRFVLGRLTLRAALDALERRCGARLAAVEMPFGAAAVDVDKPADLVLAEAALNPAGGTLLAVPLRDGMARPG
ncbi:NTP transferase domain-containing protein [Siccirubricoccus phaeus]|uniref:NTP transferase domain-containing protein n=1 Tax=Siccirubricoccus phaeus TaxID=2595053 RepID=UPI0011F3D0E4|nr:NTP transferase domain-containing protein [Siccirubricoccus phaeus]